MAVKWRAGLFATIESDERGETVNWKKILLYIGAVAASASVTPWLQTVASGHPVPFTWGTVLVPGLLAALKVGAALFTGPPNSNSGN